MARLVMVFGALCVVSFPAVYARQAVPAIAPKPLVPAATNSIVANPDAYYGQSVTITAAVDSILSPTSFTVDQDPKKSDRPLLVLVDVLTAPLAPNSYVTVIGEVVRHDGTPAVRATSVITAAMIDIARRPPPPLTPDEEAYDRTMKRIGAAFTAVREAVTASGGENARADADLLTAAFIEAEGFWKKREKPDAQKWAAEARQHANVLAQAVRTGKWDEASAAVGSLQQTCSSCHGAYRERLDDGSYRIRVGH